MANRPLYVLVHGWISNGNCEMNQMLKSAILAVQDANVIVVDWRTAANSNYLTVANEMLSVGQFLGNFLIWLINNTEGNWNNLHLIGYSLGAHVVGIAGRTANARPARITGTLRNS